LGIYGTRPSGINNSGQIVGVYSDTAPITATSTTNGQHGFLYSSGTFTTLNDPLGIYGTQAHGINNLGQIVGSYSTGSCGGCGGAFLYSNGVYMTLVGMAYALGINDLGQIVGLGLSGQAVLYSNGIYTTLNDPPGGFGTEPIDINNLGQISGSYTYGNASHGFLYSNGIYTNIDFPLGGGPNFAGGINNMSQIVGSAYSNDNGSTTPLPAALPLFATGLGALGLLGWHRKRKAYASPLS
jgi:probable HAF family extracellular repeat protein